MRVNRHFALFCGQLHRYIVVMIFWFIIAAMALLACAILILATTRKSNADTPVAAYDLQVYRDQLAEVDRDLDRGVIDPTDAERVRTEVSRRILAADAAAQVASKQGAATGPRPIMWGLVGAVLLGGSAFTYLQLGAPGYGDLALADRIATAQQVRESRPSQADAEASLADTPQPNRTEQSEEYIALVDRLRGVVAERPNDTAGLRLLAMSERNLGNFTEAHKAFDRYVGLRGDEATGTDFADLADMMVLAAGGYVSPDAERALAEALRRDRTNGPARYYWGLMMSQTGRPDQAFRIWDQLLREGPPEAPWIPPVQAQIDEMAIRAGVNYSQPQPGTGRGPSAEDVEAAGEMTAAERMEMIEGMVAGLSDRLATEGGTYQEWGQLITALGVLGRFNDSKQVYDNALQVFANDPNAIDFINRAGDRAGVAN